MYVHIYDALNYPLSLSFFLSLSLSFSLSLFLSLSHFIYIFNSTLQPHQPVSPILQHQNKKHTISTQPI